MVFEIGLAALVEKESSPGRSTRAPGSFFQAVYGVGVRIYLLSPSGSCLCGRDLQGGLPH